MHEIPPDETEKRDYFHLLIIFLPKKFLNPISTMSRKILRSFVKSLLQNSHSLCFQKMLILKMGIKISFTDEYFQINFFDVSRLILRP